MTEAELAAILRRMYQNAPKGEEMTTIQLFGIRYAAELYTPGVSVNSVAKIAGIGNMKPWITGGMRLAEYVDLNDQAVVRGLWATEDSSPFGNDR